MKLVSLVCMGFLLLAVSGCGESATNTEAAPAPTEQANIHPNTNTPPTGTDAVPNDLNGTNVAPPAPH